MTKNIISLKTTDTLIDASKLLKKHNISSLPVVDKGKAIGIITTTDMMNMSSLSEENKHIDPWTPITDIMTHPVVTILEEDSLKKASQMMQSKSFHHLIVLNNNGDLTGVLSSLDLARAFLKD